MAAIPMRFREKSYLDGKARKKEGLLRVDVDKGSFLEL